MDAHPFLGALPRLAYDFRDVWRRSCPLDRAAGGPAWWMEPWLGAAAAWRAHGLLPYAAGYAEQPAHDLDVIEILAAEYGRIEAGRRKLAEQERKARDALSRR